MAIIVVIYYFNVHKQLSFTNKVTVKLFIKQEYILASQKNYYFDYVMSCYKAFTQNFNYYSVIS